MTSISTWPIIDDPDLLPAGGVPGPAVHQERPDRAGVRPLRWASWTLLLRSAAVSASTCRSPSSSSRKPPPGSGPGASIIHLGMDGISLLLVLLTTLILPLCVLCSWRYIRAGQGIHDLPAAHGTAMVGVFCALDFVLFYVFWEAMLIPMYLLIAVWGGPRKVYASLKFFIYTMAGSVLLLVAIIALYIANGTFSIPELMGKTIRFDFQIWVFLAFAISFAIKVPDVSLPHLAAGRPRGGPHRRQRDPGQRSC